MENKVSVLKNDEGKVVELTPHQVVVLASICTRLCYNNSDYSESENEIIESIATLY